MHLHSVAMGGTQQHVISNAMPSSVSKIPYKLTKWCGGKTKLEATYLIHTCIRYEKFDIVYNYEVYLRLSLFPMFWRIELLGPVQVLRSQPWTLDCVQHPLIQIHSHPIHGIGRKLPSYFSKLGQIVLIFDVVLISYFQPGNFEPMFAYHGFVFLFFSQY